MTHTLHRYGPAEDQADDFLVLAMPARGFDERTAIERQKEFLRRALRHGPVNIGDTAQRSWHHSEKGLKPWIHWRRPERAMIHDSAK